ncbi:MAG: 30S ribosomal protein S17, partial [Gammaproteobacteria bacterium]|nr:30S ribosomal protein S17 [Gammaproteobacteria bacterium]
RLLAHDEGNTSREGDLVTITECRPYSKRKAWRLVQVLRRAETGDKVAV